MKYCHRVTWLRVDGEDLIVEVESNKVTSISYLNNLLFEI